MIRQTEKFYNTFSVFYPLVDMFLKPQKQKLFKEINNLPFGKVLEIGVGNGSHLQYYKKHQVIGIDISSNMLEIARKQKYKNIKLLQMDGEALLFEDKTFDYIIISHVIAVVNNPEKLLEESYRVLKPKGKIYILNHFTPMNWLRYIDKILQIPSKFLHFKSIFKIDSIDTINKFTFLKEIDFSKLSYFKLLIYYKE